jgi:hypothetical protein
MPDGVMLRRVAQGVTHITPFVPGRLASGICELPQGVATGRIISVAASESF